MRHFFRGNLGQAKSFNHLSQEELDVHCSIDCYGRFRLTHAIRPSYDLQIVPRQGYRRDFYRGPDANVPCLAASVSRERLFDVFLDMLEPLGETVNVVLESSHGSEEHVDYPCREIELKLLQSLLWDYEELLLHDGCTGIAVMAIGSELEVQFEEHKLLIAYGLPMLPWTQILHRYQVYHDRKLKFVSEADHIHSSQEDYPERFQQLRLALGDA